MQQGEHSELAITESELERENERLKAALLEIQGIALGTIKEAQSFLLGVHGEHKSRLTIKGLGIGRSRQIIKRISELDERPDTEQR